MITVLKYFEFYTTTTNRIIPPFPPPPGNDNTISPCRTQSHPTVWGMYAFKTAREEGTSGWLEPAELKEPPLLTHPTTSALDKGERLIHPQPPPPHDLQWTGLFQEDENPLLNTRRELITAN